MKKTFLSMAALLICMSSSVFGGPMGLTEYKKHADESANAGRCADGGIPKSECDAELLYAKNNNLITLEVYNYGIQSGFYPVIDRHNVIKAICKCGCFAPGTKILVSGDYGLSTISVEDLTANDSVMALNDESTLASPSMSEFGIKTIVSGPETPELYVFKLSNGAELTVSQHHGMLLANGTMSAAKDVTTEDSMLTDIGEVVTIAQIDRKPAEGDVYNFEVDGDEKINHIISAEGILVGEVVWQNQYAADMGSVLLRQ